MPINAFEDSSRRAEDAMHAGTGHVPNTAVSSENRERPRRVLGATTLAGAGVRNSAGDNLGKIEDIMLDLAGGQIAYTVLSFGGFLGIGDKLFLVPWSALSFDHVANEFILDIPRAVLKQAPGFDKDHWPDMADPVYGREIHRHYSRRPYWENTTTEFGGGEFTANRFCE